MTRKVIHFQTTSNGRIDEGSRAVLPGRMEALRDTSAFKHPKACPGRRRFGSALQRCRAALTWGQETTLWGRERPGVGAATGEDRGSHREFLVVAENIPTKRSPVKG